MIAYDNIVEEVRRELKAGADEKTRQSGKRYFREEVNLYGMKAADVRKISKAWYMKIRDLSKPEIFDLCEEFWRSGYLEESFVACDWSYQLHKEYEPVDFEIFQRWVDRYVHNWASCDTLCNHNVGDFIQKFPDYTSRLRSWARSDNLWMRRGAAVTFIIPGRKGKFLEDILLIADILLKDQEDMVQKGYGWMLKAASQAYHQEIYDFVMERKDVMPRTAFRYAIEKMPPEVRREAMKR